MQNQSNVSIPDWAILADGASTEAPVGAALVSNGRQLVWVDSTQLSRAAADGFYQPAKHGRTIVSDGRCLFEIPAADLTEAKSRGFHAIALTSGVGGNAAASQNLVEIGEQIEQVQTEELQAESELDEAIENATGFRRLKLWLARWYEEHLYLLGDQYKATTVSAAVHIAIILVLASMFMAVPPPKGVVIISSISDEPEDFVEEIVIETEPVEESEMEEEVTDPEITEAVEVAAEAPIAEVADFAEAIRGDAVAPPVTQVSMKTGPPMPQPKGKPSKFFSSKMAYTNYAFVIDNSLSMTKGRFETALIELDRAIAALTPKQRFYVAFYSDRAYGMMHPNTVTTLVPATDENKLKLRRWLNTVELCLRTNGKDAIARSFALNPDVIFILGDGAFGDKADQFFTARPQNRIPVHTRGMEVKPDLAASFAALARAHGGTYKNVQVSPEGASMAKKFPRKRNRIRSQFWGLNLPLVDKKKN